MSIAGHSILLLVTHMSFAHKLRAVSSKVIVNLQKYVNQVQKECERKAKQGLTKATIYLNDFSGDSVKLREELQKLGLEVGETGDLDQTLFVDVQWAPLRKRPATAVRKRPAKCVPPGSLMKRRKKQSTAASSSAKNFADELRLLSSKSVPDISKFVEKVQEECLQRAKSGHKKATIYLEDFACDPNELREELEMLGLHVSETGPLLDETQYVDVAWPSAEDRTLFQPSGLTSGNHPGECKVCFQRENLCRLHPCGHLIGSKCGAKILEQPNKSCPFCRRAVRFAHAVFEA